MAGADGREVQRRRDIHILMADSQDSLKNLLKSLKKTLETP